MMCAKPFSRVYQNRKLFLAVIIGLLVVTSCLKDDAIGNELEEKKIEEGGTPKSDQKSEIEEDNVLLPLPLVFIHTNGVQIVNEPKIDGNISVEVEGEIVHEGNIAIELRGSSSLSFAKKGYGFETRDALNEDMDVSFFGFPEEEDWILHGPYSDKSLIRNHLIYNLARKMGDYASRSQLVELNINGSYQGLYVFMEKLKRDKNRIAISKLNTDEISGEDLTGGYIIKIDKSSNGYTEQNSFLSDVNISGQETKFLYEYPKPEEIALEQKQYIKDYVLEFERVLASTKFKDPENGYANFIDTESFIDFFILNEISNNVDGYRISTYLHKDKGEKLRTGPIWDFNLAFGNVNYCDCERTDVWAYRLNERCSQDFFQVPFWWGRLLEDPVYVAKLRERWNFLRTDLLSMASLEITINGYVEQLNLNQTVKKNFERWPVLGTLIGSNTFIGNTYEEEMEYLKEWIHARLIWMDAAIANL